MNANLLRFVPGSSASLIFFTAFTLIQFAAMAWFFKKADGTVGQGRTPHLAAFFVFVALFSWAVHSGIVIHYAIPLVPLIFVALLAISAAFAFSRPALATALKLPLALLIGFQGFRLPLELLLHHWASTETIPSTMTWSGQNWDIVSGIIALLAAPFVGHGRLGRKLGTKYGLKIAWFANTVGFVLLLNVLRVVVMSSPLPISWKLESPLQLIFYLPYAWIGPMFVAPALMGHLITFRVLRAQKLR